MRLRSRFARVLAVATLALAAAACTPPLDTNGLEDTLKDQVAKDTGATITTVDCPDVKAEAGGTFECTATDDSGATFVLKVTQTDDQGNVVYDYVNAEAPGSATPTP
jgi:predicted secreted protein